MVSNLVSVVIPIYNIESYLPACIESVTKQTYANIEIILVDDGATDLSGHICDDYAAKDDRIAVIHKPNGGLSDARNAGISIAKGDYLLLVDGDDLIAKNTVELLYEGIIKTKSDISVCAFLPFADETALTAKVAKKDYNVVSSPIEVNNIDAIEMMLYQKSFDVSACGKLYSKRLFDNINYPVECKIFEDVATTYKLFLLANKVAFQSKPLYFYRQRSGSLIHSGFNDRELIAVELLDEMKERLSDYPKLKKSIASRSISLYFQIGLKNFPAEFDEQRIEIENRIKSLRRTVLFDKQARYKNRVAACLSYLGFGVLRKIYKFF